MTDGMPFLYCYSWLAARPYLHLLQDCALKIGVQQFMLDEQHADSLLAHEVCVLGGPVPPAQDIGQCVIPNLPCVNAGMQRSLRGCTSTAKPVATLLALA